MSFPTNGDGSQRAFNADELRAMQFRTADVKDGSNPTFSFGVQGSTIRRAWFVKWDQMLNACCALLGRAQIYPSGGDLKLSRVMPFVVPGFPQYAAIEIESVTGALSAGRDDANTIPAYKCAKIVVRHELVWFDLAADDSARPNETYRYMETMPSTTESTYLTLPGSIMKYRTSIPAVNGVIIPYNVGKVESVTKRSFKWHRVPRNAWGPGTPLYARVKGDVISGSRGFVGTVNKTEFMGMPIGTMLFDGVDEELIADPMYQLPGDTTAGNFAWNLTFRFSERTLGSAIGEGLGWNFLFFGGGSNAFNEGYYQASKAAAYTPPGTVPDGACLFDERNHNSLFIIGAAP